MLIAAILLVSVLVAAAALLLASRRVTIHDFERGVLYVRGKFTRVLEPGVYWIFPPQQTVQLVDIRSRVETVSGQEVLSADSVSVKVSLALRYRVTAPEIALRSTQRFTDALYQEAQVLARDIIASLPIEELLQRRKEVADSRHERLAPRALNLGVELELASIKDFMFPGPLKRVFAQVVEARKSAQASLEKARGETATLRHLANAARMLQGNPALLTLKTLQAVSEGKNTIVLGVSQSVLPVSTEPSREPTLPSGDMPPEADET